MIRKVRRSWWVIGSKRDIEKRVCHIWWAAMGVCEYWRSPNNSWPVNINYRWLSVSRILALHDLFSIVFKSRCDVHTGNKLWQSMTRSSSFSRHLSHHWRKFSGNVSGNFHPGVPVRISLDSKQWRRVTAAVSFSITDYKLSRYFCFLLPLDQKHSPPVLNVFMKWTKRSTDDGRHVLQSRETQPVCVKPTSLTVGGSLPFLWKWGFDSQSDVGASFKGLFFVEFACFSSQSLCGFLVKAPVSCRFGEI